MVTTIETQYNIVLASDPCDNILEISISTRGTHSTLGLELDKNVDIDSRLQLMNCFQSTPLAYIIHWILTLPHQVSLAIDCHKIDTIRQITDTIKAARQANKKRVNFQFGTMEKVAMQPQSGVSIIFHG